MELCSVAINILIVSNSARAEFTGGAAALLGEPGLDVGKANVIAPGSGIHDDGVRAIARPLRS
jgi:hypothetical protein